MFNRSYRYFLYGSFAICAPLNRPISPCLWKETLRPLHKEDEKFWQHRPNMYGTGVHECSGKEQIAVEPCIGMPMLGLQTEYGELS